MPVVLRSTVIGVFDSRAGAHRAIESLKQAGFSDDDILAVYHRDEGIEVTDVDAAKAARVTGQTMAEEGAAAGAVAGGALGGLAAVALPAVIPGIGPVLSLGTLAAALVGVAGGAAGGGLVGALVGMDFPEEEARYYEGQLKAGRALVGVKALDRAAEARGILDRCGALNAASPAVVEVR